MGFRPQFSALVPSAFSLRLHPVPGIPWELRGARALPAGVGAARLAAQLKVDFSHLVPDFYFDITGGIALFKYTLLSDPHRAQILKNVFLELNQYMSRKKIQGELGVAS